jgi:hypothetical protein
MKITRDVITDLYPLYESGEASPDTQELIAEFLAADPEFAAVITDVQPSNRSDQVIQNTIKIPEEIEMQTLNKTRALIKKRSLYLAFAFLFTGLTAAFTWGPEGVRWIWADAIPGAAACGLIALISWGFFLNTRRTLESSQL